MEQNKIFGFYCLRTAGVHDIVKSGAKQQPGIHFPGARILEAGYFELVWAMIVKGPIHRLPLMFISR